MASEESAGFIYLNRDNVWSGFDRDGLELGPEGTLQLNSLPVLDGDLPSQTAALPRPDAVSGIVVDAQGNIYLCDGHRGAILRLDACTGKLGTLVCPGGDSFDLGKKAVVRGLCVVAERAALAVADSANGCIRLLAIDSQELIDVWTGSSAVADDSTLSSPTALAADRSGHVFAVDRGGERIQKFDLRGRAISDFASHVQAAGVREVADIAIDGSSLYVLYRSNGKWTISELDAEGRAVMDGHGRPRAFVAGDLHRPFGLAAGGNRVYVGDNGGRRVLVFARRSDATSAHAFAGVAIGYAGPIAGLCLDHEGGLYVHTGADMPPPRLRLAGGYGTEGIAWSSEPIVAGAQRVAWRRLKASCASLGSDAHVQLLYLASDDPAKRPPKPGVPVAAPWQALPADLSDGLLDSAPSRALWIALHLRGDGRHSARISQLRVDFDSDSYLAYLPPIYRAASAPMSFLDRFLRLFGTMNDEVEESIGQLPQLMDPAAVEVANLPWLAGWLDAECDGDWDETKRRQIVSSAVERSRIRGTVEGLRRGLALLAGVDAAIAEPVINVSWWALANEADTSAVSASCGGCGSAICDCSVLGCSTFLPAAEPDGAVLGRTAVVDQSDLIAGEDVGSPPFNRLAYRATVFVHRSQVPTSADLRRIRSVIDNEKPAHVVCEICLVEPRLRVGYQSAVGLDTVIGDAASPPALYLGDALGKGHLPGRATGHVDARNRVGVTTTLGQSGLG